MLSTHQSTQAAPIPSKLADKSHEKTQSTSDSVPKITVRELQTHEQDNEIIRLAHQFAQDVDLQEHVEDDVLRASCIRCRMDLDRHNVNCFIAYDGDRAIGFLVGVATQAFHREGIVAEQKLWYVEPTRRGTTAARKLLWEFQRWARLNGATQIYTGVANERYSERTSKLLEKIGYRRVGYTHVMEV